MKIQNYMLRARECSLSFAFYVTPDDVDAYVSVKLSRVAVAAAAAAEAFPRARPRRRIAAVDTPSPFTPCRGET